MTPTEWIGVITSAAVFPRVLQTVEAIVRARFAARKSDRPPLSEKSSDSSDKLKAIAAELEHANTVIKVNELHAALAGKDADDQGYVVPRQLKNQTVLLTSIKDEAVKQTAVLQRIANNTPTGVPRPDGTYRGRGGE